MLTDCHALVGWGSRRKGDAMSYCDCDYEPCEFAHMEDIRAARRQHKCSECRGPIFKGEPYRKTVYKFCGDLDVNRMCHLCIELEQWAKISVPCFCPPPFEGLHEQVREMVDDIRHTIPGFFFEYGRRIVKINRRKDAHG